eukprot:gene6874-30848_t
MNSGGGPRPCKKPARAGRRKRELKLAAQAEGSHVVEPRHFPFSLTYSCCPVFPFSHSCIPGESKKEKESNKKAEAGVKAEKHKEDADWASAGDGDKGKGAKKKEDEERKKQETAARKAELKKLAEEEDKAMNKKKGDKTAAQKATKYQLDLSKAQEAEAKAKEMEKKKLAASREVGEDDYASMVETSNSNRDEDVLVDARNVGEALSGLGITGEDKEDKHPEKRRKAAWLAYEEDNLPLLKEEKPGLKMMQYKDMLWKMWQKAPENPLRGVAHKEY